MNAILERLARYAVLRPWRTLAAWVLVLGAVIGLAAAFGGPAQEDWDVPDARAQVGIDQLRDHLPGYGNASAQVVVHDDAPLAPAALTDLGADLAGLDHVDTVLPPRVSDDGRTALLVVQYDVPVTHHDLYQDIDPLEDAVDPYREDGLQVELGGELPSTAVGTIEGNGELIGIVAALVILLLLFRSVVAAGLPVLVAVGGLAIGLTGVTVLCGLMSVSPTAPTVASMVGLGVGIDYALLLLVRIRENLDAATSSSTPPSARPAPPAAPSCCRRHRAGLADGPAALRPEHLRRLRLRHRDRRRGRGVQRARAGARAGQPAPPVDPAARGPQGPGAGAHRPPRRALGPLRGPPSGRVGAARRHRAARPRRPGARPAHLAGQRLGRADVEHAAPRPRPHRRGLRGGRTVAAARGGRQRAAQPADVDDVVAGLEADPDIATVAEPVVSPDGALTVVQAEAAYVDNDERTAELVERLRDDLPEGAELTGSLALYVDIVDLLAVRLWLVIGFVVGISMLMLTLMFRAPVVALKAAVMNLLSVGAAYGVLVAVFQWGWGLELLGVDHTLPISTWLPILMFTILFGLSMDYEVFLLSRIREDYARTGDAVGSVARGLAATSTVITTAAAVMVMVFLGFAAEAGVFFKMMGLGMAVAIALDATLVRMVLVPATMALLGHRNWWIPAWLDRVLPQVDVEGEIEGDVAETPREPVPAA